MASLTQAGITFGDGTSQTTAASSAFPAGTLMLFQQTSAPTGWTKQTTHDNKALRVVSGTAGSGGSVAFSSAFASQAVSGSVSVGATTLSTAQMPSHTHITTRISGVGPYGNTAISSGDQLMVYTPDGWQSVSYGSSAGWINQGQNSQSVGGGGSHTHSGSFTGTAINMAVQYVDLIICSKA